MIPSPLKPPFMPKNGLLQALDELLEHDSRYDREAYLFLKEALEFTVKQKRKTRTNEVSHVTPAELIDGVRLYALREFGPMVPTVLDYWGVKTCGDVGEMVFNLIHAGVFGKNDTDSIEDFQNGFDFHAAFVEPFLPSTKCSSGEPKSSDRPVA